MIGTIVMATGTDVSGFAGGAVLYQFGYTGVQRSFPFTFPFVAGHS